MRGVLEMDFLLMDGIAGSKIRTGDSESCTETESTAVPSHLIVALGSLTV